jgi:sister-chromatid-cohesion protein PDS5
MPRQRSDSAVPPPQERSVSKVFKFNEPLSWKAGRAIPVADLLKRLRTLSEDLKSLEQEEYDKESFNSVAKDLVGPNLLGHKDSGVRSLTACCIVDILRLCAPDAPYTENQLKVISTARSLKTKANKTKDIFAFLIREVLPNLSDPSHSYNPETTYVLRSLAQVKSIVLVTDLPNIDSLLSQLFALFFDIASGSVRSQSKASLSGSTLQHMTEILVTLVDESSSLPAEVVDVILAQFFRGEVQQSAKSVLNATSQNTQKKITNFRELSPAYSIAKSLCNSCPDKMSRYVSQYFNDVIVDVSAKENEPFQKNRQHRAKDGLLDDDLSIFEASNDEFKELTKVHQLLQELWKACPVVLQNVVPQLEAELVADNVDLRVLATQTLGDMLSGIQNDLNNMTTPDPSSFPPYSLSNSLDVSIQQITLDSGPAKFAHAYPSAYSSFLSRQQDKAPNVRVVWTIAASRLLLEGHNTVSLEDEREKQMLSNFAEKFLDQDERVRLAAVKAIGACSIPQLLTKLSILGAVNEEHSILYGLSINIKSTKPLVRLEAIKVMARLWGVTAGEIASMNPVLYDKLALIPSMIFDAIYVQAPDIKILIDQVTHEVLLPLDYPNTKGKSASIVSKEKQKKSRSTDDRPNDFDAIRIERILVLIRDLEPRAKKAFFANLRIQAQWIKVMTAIISHAETHHVRSTNFVFDI